MHAWPWRRLPNPLFIQVLLVIVLVIVVGGLLFLLVFPWLMDRLPFNDATTSAVQAPQAGQLSPMSD